MPLHPRRSSTLSACLVLTWLVGSVGAAQPSSGEVGDVAAGGSAHFHLVPLAPGVWAAAHNDSGYAISNAGIVDLGDRTLIFDTFMTPEAAADLRAAAERLTGRTPTLVVNSHGHNDHIRGNQVFRPEAEIIATPDAFASMRDDEPEQIAYERERAPERLREMEERLAGASPAEASELRMWRDYYQGMIASHAGLHTVLPTVTFEKSLTIHGSKRTAELRALSNGHTSDDVVLLLPDDGILFAGDLLFAERHPWLGDGSPRTWAESLRSLHDWGFETIVPGHGPVSSPAALLTLADYIDSLHALVRNHIEAGGTEEELTSLSIPDPYSAWWYARFFPANLATVHATLSH